MAHCLRILGMLLALFGLIGLYARQVERLGALGAWLLRLGVALCCAPTPPIAPTPWIVHVIGGVAFGLGRAGLGYGLWSEKGELARAPR